MKLHYFYQNIGEKRAVIRNVDRKNVMTVKICSSFEVEMKSPANRLQMQFAVAFKKIQKRKKRPTIFVTPRK